MDRFGLARALVGRCCLAMPQNQLPLFQASTTHLNESLAIGFRDGHVTCFNGHLSVFTHAQDDLAAFRLFTNQWVVDGVGTLNMTEAKQEYRMVMHGGGTYLPQ